MPTRSHGRRDLFRRKYYDREPIDSVLELEGTSESLNNVDDVTMLDVHFPAYDSRIRSWGPRSPGLSRVPSLTTLDEDVALQIMGELSVDDLISMRRVRCPHFIWAHH